MHAKQEVLIMAAHRYNQPIFAVPLELAGRARPQPVTRLRADHPLTMAAVPKTAGPFTEEFRAPAGVRKSGRPEPAGPEQ